VALEFALVFPVLLLLLFSVIELGSAWYNRQLLVNASREGARLAALSSGMQDSDIVSEVQTILNQSGFPGSATVISSGASGGPGTLVNVQITAPVSMPVLGALVPGVDSSQLVTANTVMRHE
jgi:Flp pilus assembly protein TadG